MSTGLEGLPLNWKACNDVYSNYSSERHQEACVISVNLPVSFTYTGQVKSQPL